MKIQQKTYHSDVIMSLMTLFVVAGLVFTGLNALKDGELSAIQSEFSVSK